MADRMGYKKIIEDAGGVIVCDTCPSLHQQEIWPRKKDIRYLPQIRLKWPTIHRVSLD